MRDLQAARDVRAVVGYLAPESAPVAVRWRARAARDYRGQPRSEFDQVDHDAHGAAKMEHVERTTQHVFRRSARINRTRAATTKKNAFLHRWNRRASSS